MSERDADDHVSDGRELLAEVVAEHRRRGYRVRRDDAAIASAFWG